MYVKYKTTDLMFYTKCGHFKLLKSIVVLKFLGHSSEQASLAYVHNKNNTFFVSDMK